jgi:hypothetical protein
MNRSFLLALAAACIALPVSLHTQAPVAPEEVVRIHAPPAGLRTPTVGTVLDVRRDTLVVQTSELDTIRGGTLLNQRVIPLSSVWSLEVPVGRRSRARGAAIGGLAGTGTGLLAAALHKKFSIRHTEPAPCPPNVDPCTATRLQPYPQSRSVGIVVTGAVIGTAAGAVWSGRRWRHVFPVTAEGRVTESGGVQVSGTLRF